MLQCGCCTCVYTVWLEIFTENMLVAVCVYGVWLSHIVCQLTCLLMCLLMHVCTHWLRFGCSEVGVCVCVCVCVAIVHLVPLSLHNKHVQAVFRKRACLLRVLLFNSLSPSLPLPFSRDCKADGRPFHLFRLLVLYHDPELCSFLDTKKLAPEVYLQQWVWNSLCCKE